jgi:hypothetical protein
MEESVQAVPQPVPAVPAVVALGATSAAGGELVRKVLKVAWLSIALGLVLEVILLVVVAYAGAAGNSPKPFLADLVQKVSWSFIVCVGVAFGSTAGKLRPIAMGVLGLLSAPAAFNVARSLHKGVKDALGIAGPAAAGASPFLIGTLKGVEYAVLGAVIGRIGQRWGGRLGAYAGAGIAVGLVFGGAILAVMIGSAPAPLPTAELVSRGLNELIFPLGCSLVIYAADVLGKRLN